MIREALRALGQVFGFALAERRLGLWLLVILGLIAAFIATVTSLAGPVLIYPIL